MPNQYNAADRVNVPGIKYPHNIGYGSPLGPSGVSAPENREASYTHQAEGTRISQLRIDHLQGSTLLDSGLYAPVASGFSGTITKF